MRRLPLALVSVAVGGLLAGCGASSPPPQNDVPTTAGNRLADHVRPAPPKPHLLRVSATAYGHALTDRRGFAVYRFTHDTMTASTCYGACAGAWPPYLVPRGPARTADGALVGTTRRADGRLQVTYAGHPLYYYVGDRRPGQVLCQGVAEFGGSWYVVAPSGRLIQ